MVRDEADEGDKVGGGHVLVQLLLDVDADVRRQDLHERLGRQLPHRVILDGAAGQIWIDKVSLLCKRRLE